jgi:hypothetical protein
MSKSRRLCRVTLVAVAGLIAVVGLAPTASAAQTHASAQVMVVHGPGWCC